METKFKVGDKIRIKSKEYLTVLPLTSAGKKGVIISGEESRFYIEVPKNRHIGDTEVNTYIAYSKEMELVSSLDYKYVI